MNNTDKLLRALIDALGFDVEKIITHNETPITKQMGELKIFQGRSNSNGDDGLVTVGNHGPYKRGDDECYYLDGGTDIDYKVTKKKPQVCFDVDSPEWNAIVTFVLNQADDIEHGIEGYGDLKPMLDYFNRNCINETKL